MIWYAIFCYNSMDPTLPYEWIDFMILLESFELGIVSWRFFLWSKAYEKISENEQFEPELSRIKERQEWEKGHPVTS